MERGVSSQPRITVWPGTALLQPHYQRHLHYRLDGTGQVLVPDGESVHVRPSGETYLRLLAVDLDDPEAIRTFANKYGTLGGFWARADLRRIPVFEIPLDHARELRLTRAVRESELVACDTAEAGLRLPFETLDSFRFVACVLRDLARAWRVIREGVDPETIPWELKSERSLPPFPAGEHAEILFLYALEPMLTIFSPHVQLPSSEPYPEGGVSTRPGEWGETLAVEAARGPSTPHLYQLCALELYNHIVENAVYKRCHNETCGQPFVRQLGRAEFQMSRRQGVMYCSASCANAQAQRQHRRRKRAREAAATTPPATTAHATPDQPAAKSSTGKRRN